MSWAEAKWLVDKVVQKVGQCPNNMQSFTATQSSDTQVSLLFLEPEDSYSGESLICKVSGVMIRMSEDGYPTDPSDGVLVLDNKNLGAYRNEAYVVSGLEPGGTYYFTAFPYSEQGVYNLSRDKANRACNHEPAGQGDGWIYGVSRLRTASSPVWARTDDAIDMTATASVGTVPGHSDFDDRYPWSGIKRETLSTGDVMVKIPKFWFKRYRVGDVEYIQIADSPVAGFALHPAFYHAGVEKDSIYVGAYKTSSENRSVSGAAAQTTMTRDSFRTSARAKGNGWGLIDISALSAIQMLFLVEFATNDSQSAIGKGLVNTEGAQTVGTCDTVPNLTGMAVGTNGNVDIVWRGIEGLWGHIWEFVDGMNCQDGTYYVCNDPSKYADDTATGYESLSYDIETGLSEDYITRTGIDSGNNPHVILPSNATGGSSSTYLCDGAWSATEWRAYAHGYYLEESSLAGLFSCGMSYRARAYGTNAGSRLLYIPQ